MAHINSVTPIQTLTLRSTTMVFSYRKGDKTRYALWTDNPSMATYLRGLGDKDARVTQSDDAFWIARARQEGSIWELPSAKDKDEALKIAVDLAKDSPNFVWHF